MKEAVNSKGDHERFSEIVTAKDTRENSRGTIYNPLMILSSIHFQINVCTHTYTHAVRR